MPEQPGRRERKKRQTHQAIQAAALELFALRGYRETTLREIADRANVAPRTLTVHFATKEELLFDAEPFRLETLIDALDSRSGSALDALRDWMRETMAELDAEGDAASAALWQRRAVRIQIINAEPELRGRARSGYYEMERVLADALGADLGQPGTALIPRLAALTVATGLRELYESDEAQALGPEPTATDLLTLVDRVIAFARAGIDGASAAATKHDS